MRQKLLRFRWWSAVAALVVVPFQGAHAAAAPHLTDLFCNDAKALLFPAHMISTPAKAGAPQNQCGSSCSASGGGRRVRSVPVEHVAQQAPAGSARPLHASHTCSGDPRSTCGTGRAVREVPSIQQVPLLSMSRDLTTHKRARPTVDWARETFARRTRALQTRDQHAAPVAQLERRQGPWSAVR